MDTTCSWCGDKPARDDRGFCSWKCGNEWSMYEDDLASRERELEWAE